MALRRTSKQLLDVVSSNKLHGEPHAAENCLEPRQYLCSRNRHDIGDFGLTKPRVLRVSAEAIPTPRSKLPSTAFPRDCSDTYKILQYRTSSADQAYARLGDDYSLLSLLKYAFDALEDAFLTRISSSASYFSGPTSQLLGGRVSIIKTFSQALNFLHMLWVSFSSRTGMPLAASVLPVTRRHRP